METTAAGSARGRGAAGPPDGTLTFLFTDIEGSTRIAEALGPAGFTEQLERHRRVVRDALAAHEGHEVSTEGDSFFVVFGRASDAIAAAAAIQRALAGAGWPPGVEIRVRIGAHTGEAVLVDGNYAGHAVHRAARIAAAGHGGQVLLSEATVTLVAGLLPPGTELRGLGEHRLKDLQPEHICQLVIPGLRNDFPPIRSLDSRRNNLPTQLTSFIGREREIGEVAELLGRARLVTLSGPGGTGKTRLSLQVAAEVADRFADGVTWVPLASITDPDLVASEIAAAVGAPDATGQSAQDRLANAVRARELLLVLDNFEQVVAAAPVLAHVLREAPGVRILVSSRAALRVSGEHESPLSPLSLPDPASGEAGRGSEAVTLFVERARAVRPSFELGQDNAAAIAEIVTRLDGLPLAIELAAARSRLLTPEAMLPRLERRLDLLRSGSADLPARQQTLRGAIAWSHDLLDAPERRLFARLAVFMPGGGLDQVEAVCGPASEIGRDVLDTLESLVEHSLVRQREWEGEPRFGMLATIREFAAEQLAAEPDAATIGDRHLAAYVSVAETAAPHLTSADGRAWLDRIDVEHDNMRAALAWAAERNEPALAMRLVASLWRFWQIRGHLLEGIGRAEEALAIEGEVPPEIRLAAVDAAGGLTYWHGDLPATTAWYQQALTLRRSIGGDATIAQGLYNLAFPVTFGDGLVEEAMAYGQEAVDRFRRAGDDGGLARSLWLLSNIASQAGDNAGARRYGLEAIPMLQRLQDSFLLGWSLFTVGLLDALEGDLPVARRRLREALEHFHGVGDRSGLVLVLDGIAAVAWLGGEHRTAARISGAVARLERTTGTGLNPWNRRSIGFDPAPLRDDPATADDYRRGEADDDETIVAFALATMAG